MKYLAIPGLAAVAALLLIGFGHQGQAETAGGASARTDVVYVCDCGPQCQCASVGLKPGNCKCGSAMKWGHVLRIDGDVATVCTCAEGCTCKGLDPKDPTKCACGNPVKKVSLKGSGIYFCNCGGSCQCNVLSDKPGECKCGMQLKQST